MKQSYAAFLGHQPVISLAELSACIPDFTLKNVLQKKVAIFETDAEIPSDFIDSLGGTLFLAKQLDAGQKATLEDLPKLLYKDCQQLKRGKITFSYRSVGLHPDHLRMLYRKTKEIFKKHSRPCRYVGSERKAVQAVVLHENDMITGKLGCEYVVLHDDELGLWFGKTIGAHDIDAYTKRDIEKPVRDTNIGLLPPKLAQILLNLGVFAVQYNKKPKELKKFKLPKLTVLDPFCGTGVIPIECLLRGWDVAASDLSQKAVNDTTKNLDWLRKEEKIAKKDTASEIAKHDARKPFTVKLKPDVLVTETSLGPNLVKRPTLKEVNSMSKELEELEAAFLKNAKECYPNTPIVCTFPVWHHSKGKTYLEKIWNTIRELGYLPVLPFEGEVKEGQRPSMLYRRPEQFVGREIVILIPA